MQTYFLLLCCLLASISVSVTVKCNLTHVQKFSSQCSNVQITLPSTIYNGEEFALSLKRNIKCCEKIENISLFLSTDDYCGPDSFNAGIVCAFSQQKSIGAIVALVTCNGEIILGNVTLVLGLSANKNVNCSIAINTIWGQSTYISLSKGVKVENLFAISNTEEPVNITCTAFPQGPYPTLTAYPFTSHIMLPIPVYIVNNTSVVASFSGGLTSGYSGVYTCTSETGYTSTAYIVILEKLPIVFYPDGNYLEVPVGNSINITAILLTVQTINLESVHFRSLTNASKSLTVHTSDGWTFVISKDSVGVSDNGVYKFCYQFNNNDENNEGSVGSFSDFVCKSEFNLTITIPTVMISSTTIAASKKDFTNGLITITCTPSNQQAIIMWTLQDGTPLWTAYPSYIFEPNNLNHTVTVVSAPENNTVFLCGLPNPGENGLLNKKSVTTIITEEVSDGCPTEITDGSIWTSKRSSTTVTKRCRHLSNEFYRGTATRFCDSNGEWSPVDYSDCRVNIANDFIYMWIMFTGVDRSTIESNLTNIQNQTKTFLHNHNIKHSDMIVSLDFSIFDYPWIDISATLPSFNHSNEEKILAAMSELQSIDEFAGLTTVPSSNGLYVFTVTNSCYCQSLHEDSPIINVCVGSYSKPCDCNDGVCQCTSFYVGDGILCTLDRDGDLYPDVPLDSCSENSTETYCIKDNCVSIYNPTQDPSVCAILPDYFGCPFGTDSQWWITWANTPFGETDEQPCPGYADTIGKATRYCSILGWSSPDVSDCLSKQYQSFLDRMSSAFACRNSIEMQLTDIRDIINDIQSTLNDSSQGQVSHLPRTLHSINFILSGTINLLFDTLKYNHNTTLSDIVNSLYILDVFDSLLSNDNRYGWEALREDSSYGSTTLLENIERYGLYYAYIKEDFEMKGSNINIRSLQYRISQNISLVFGNLNNISSNGSSYVIIPKEVLTELGAQDNEIIPIVSIQFQNIENFLITNTSFNDSLYPVSSVWSGQVSNTSIYFKQPINITFPVDEINHTEYQYQCVYWNVEEGTWSTDGVSTAYYFRNSEGQTFVNCHTYHLTAFAVLVDVAGGVNAISPTNYEVLNVISYIGCGVSVACLLLTIIFFCAQCKHLFETMHYFIHLNLAFAMFCGYCVFAIGVDLASREKIGCTFVAALLHYFFLASFCWMLCEGVMLYLMLVVVFSTMTKRWWFFLLLGWVTPLIPVFIGLSSGYNNYGVKDEKGKLLYCWLSFNSGVIWAFVAPMIIIIIINTVFYILVLCNLWRSKSKQNSRQLKWKKNRHLVIGLLKGAVILLPLLGLTWLCGLLAVNENTQLFAWIFTIFNSLQGAAVFFLHVVRNEKVWSKLTLYFFNNQTKTYDMSTSGKTQSTFKNGSFSNGGVRIDSLKYYVEKQSQYHSVDSEKNSIESLRNTPELQTVNEEQQEEAYFKNGFTNSLSGSDESIQQEDDRINTHNKITMDINESEDDTSLKSEAV